MQRSQHILKVRDFFITDVLLLYLRVLLGRLLLEVWGGRGDGRKLSSQDVAHRPLTLHSASETELCCQPGDTKHTFINQSSSEK